jgi:chemotaxis signal transduction protein
MRAASQPGKPAASRTEQIILFRVSGQLFAISSASVQEVRSVDSLAGVSSDIHQPTIRKVRQVLHRGDKSLYVVNTAIHFGLPVSSANLVFVLRKTRTALLVDTMERMATMSRLQALPLAYCHEERRWYRGLTALDQTVLPVVDAQGFLTGEEFSLLDAAFSAQTASEAAPANSPEPPQ